MSAGDDPALAGLILEPEQRPPLPAGRRRPADDPRRPPARVRQPRRATASTASSSSTRTTSPGARDRRRRPEGRVGQRRARTRRSCSRTATPGQDLTLTIDASLQVAVEQELLARVDRRPREARVGRGDGPLHRRGLRLRELPLVRRERLPGDRRRGPGRVRRPDRVDGLRAGLGVQDDDRDRGPGRRASSRRRRRSRDTGTLRLDGGRAQVDNADHQAHGRR